MDPNLGKQLTDIRGMLEKTTSKVSLRDLEKKGFRKVKVLRAADINQLIYKAVQTVIAKGGPQMGAAEREKILKESQDEFNRLMKQVQEAQKAEKAANRAATEAEEKVQQAGAKALEVERHQQQVEASRAQLEAQVSELNRKLVAEKQAFEREKQEFALQKQELERQKQELYTTGMQTQATTVQAHQKQVEALQRRLEEAQSIAMDSKSQVTQAEARARSEVERLVEEARREGEREASAARREAQEAKLELDRAAAKAKAQADARVKEYERKVEVLEEEKLKAAAGSEQLKEAMESARSFEREAKRLREAEEDYKARLTSARERALELEKELEGVKQKNKGLRGASDDLEAAQARVTRQKAHIEELEADLKKAKRRISELEADAAGFERRLKDSAAKETELDSMRGKVKELEEAVVAAKKSGHGSVQDKKEIERLRNELQDAYRFHQAQSTGMLDEIKKMIELRPANAATASSAGGGELSEQLTMMQHALSQQLSRIRAGTDDTSQFMRADGTVDLSALFAAQNASAGKIESNIGDVKMKESKGGNVRSKLNKLKKLRGGGA